MPGTIQNGMQILRDNWDYKRARFCFWPVVSGFTLMFGFINGTKGAIVGFLYGIAAGLFLIHESLPAYKKTR
jgi:hypothetical protein